MGKKATKASRKYAASGQLKKEIQARKKHQQVKRAVERRKGGGGKTKGRDGEANGSAGTRPGITSKEDEVDDDLSEEDNETGKFKGMNVDDFLKGGFMEDGSEVRLQHVTAPKHD